MTFVDGRKAGHGKASRDGAWVLTHRLVMEDHLGRELATAEHVHHINGDTRDNRLENLEVLSLQAHMALHGDEKRGEPRPDLRVPRRPCQWCGKPIKHTKKRVKTCSVSCGGLLRHHGAAAAPINGGPGSRLDAQPAAPNTT